MNEQLRKYNFIQICMLLLCVLLFLNLNASFEYVLGIGQFVSPLILLLCILLFVQITRLKIIPYFFPLTIFFIFIILYLCVGVMGTLIYESFRHPRSDLYDNIESLVNCLIISFVFFAYSIYAQLTDRFENFLKFLFYLTAVGSLCVILFSIWNIQVTATELGDRRSGLFANPNEAGLVAMINIVLAYYFIMKPSTSKWLYVFGIMLSVIAVLLTLSKSAVAMLLLIVLAALIWYGTNINRLSFMQRKVILGMYIFILGVAVFLAWNWTSYINLLSYSQLVRLEQFHDLLSGDLSKDVTSDRNILFAEAFRLAKAHPLTGIGLGNISRMKHVGLGAHNTFLMVWGEAGILVVSIFVLLLLYILYRCLYLPRIENSFTFTALLLILIFQSYMVTHNGFDFRISNALFGICMAVVYIYSSKPYGIN